jgi:hypothetical protein
MNASRDADFALHVELLETTTPPSADFSTTVGLAARWTLTDKAGGRVFEDTVRSEHTCTLGDAFVGTKRLQLTKEGAARANIRLGIERLSQLAL